MRAQKKNKNNLFLAIFSFTALALAGWIYYEIQPVENGTKQIVELSRRMSIKHALEELQKRGIIANHQAAWPYMVLVQRMGYVGPGVFQLNPGMSLPQIAQVFRKPLKRLLRVPEGWWIKRVAQLLEEKKVCRAKDYIALTNQPQLFQEKVKFDLPKSGSLEGYLFPDTYDWPMNTPAKKVITDQLKEFEKRIYAKVPQAQRHELERLLVMGSMLELESATYQDRRRIAGVFENRLKKNMRLQSCATALYAAQEWRELKHGDTKRIKSPYSTYHHHGLPPGPICSPTLNSIKAAMNPERHDDLYFVWVPGKGHVYSKDFQRHLKAINERKAALAAQ